MTRGVLPFVRFVTRILALGIVVVALAGSAPAGGKLGPFYALRYGAETNVLVPYDPVRLVPTGAPSIRTGAFGHAWSISPDRSRFAASAGWTPTLGRTTAIRFVDLAAGRVESTVSLPDEVGRVIATAWVRGRVLAVSTVRTSTVSAIDPEARKAVGRVELPGIVLLGERTQTGLVLLLAPRDGIGPATLAVVDRALHVRTAAVTRISAGWQATGVGEGRRTTHRRPALALSPAGKTAYVLGGGEPAATIDLRTMSVSYAPLRLVAAIQKNFDGVVRSAASLPDGRLVVSGFDYGIKAAGVWLVDPHDWSSSVVDPKGSWYAVGGGLVFARGERGLGLRIVQPSGKVSELFAGRTVVTLDVVGPRALVIFAGTAQKAAVVELWSGRVLRQSVPASPLVGAGQPIYG